MPAATPSPCCDSRGFVCVFCREDFKMVGAIASAIYRLRRENDRLIPAPDNPKIPDTTIPGKRLVMIIKTELLRPNKMAIRSERMEPLAISVRTIIASQSKATPKAALRNPAPGFSLKRNGTTSAGKAKDHQGRTKESAQDISAIKTAEAKNGSSFFIIPVSGFVKPWLWDSILPYCQTIVRNTCPPPSHL